MKLFRNSQEPMNQFRTESQSAVQFINMKQKKGKLYVVTLIGMVSKAPIKLQPLLQYRY
jgi:hypothetical protein